MSAMMAVASPMPLKGIRNPSMLMEGMVYRKLIAPSVGFAAFWYSLIRMPAMPPNTMAMMMATRQISTCSTSSPWKKSHRWTRRSQVCASIYPLFSMAWTGQLSKQRPQCRQWSCMME